MREYSGVYLDELLDTPSEPTPPYYEFFGSSFVIHDPVWGECRIGEEGGDQVLLALLHNPLVRRMMAIEQLSLDEWTETVSDTAPFTRWEHMWGSVAFVRKMTEGKDMDARDRLILQLRTFVSDLGHTAFSHIGDWITQHTMTENQHDLDLPQLLEQSGIIDLLESFDIAKEEILPETQDWVECDSPELCVDRVDYAARQLLRWFGDDETARRVLRPESFDVVDGRLVMNNEEDARWFSKAFLLLSTEHFSEPFHRMQLKLQEEVVRYIMACPVSSLSSLHDSDRDAYAPRELMYTIDEDINIEAYKLLYSRCLRELMAEFGAIRRRHFTKYRQPAMREYLLSDTAEYPDPFADEQRIYQKEIVDIVLKRAIISLQPVSTAEAVEPKDIPEEGVFEFFLQILKPRFIDAPYKKRVSEEEVKNGVVHWRDPKTNEAFQICRMSEDENFKRLLAEQSRVFQRPYLGRLSISEGMRGIFAHGREELAVEWHKALDRPQMPQDVFRRLLVNSVAVAALFRKIELLWYD